MTLKQFQDNLMFNSIIKPSKSHILPLLSVILNGSKNKIPVSTEQFLQIDSPLPQDDTQAVSRQSDVVLNNKSSPNIILPVCLWFWMALKKNPCFHRTISIQIDSPLPQDDTQAVSRQSDVVLNNKSSPNLTFYLTCLWFWMALKRKIPVSTDNFNSDWQSTTQDDTQAVSRQSDVELIIKALQISYHLFLWFEWL